MAISKDIKAWARQEMRFKARQDREAEEVLHKRELKQFEDKVKQAEDRIKQFEEQARQAEDRIKQFEEQARQAEDRIKQFEEQARQAEEQAKIAEEKSKKAKSETMKTVAQGLKAENIPPETIAKITGLSAEQVATLQLQQTIDLNSLTKEQIALAAKCKTPEELIELAKKMALN